MKRVAIIGADFVPSSLPPATRIRFFARHLPEFGWEPIIISTDPSYYDWQFDSENEQLLPESLEVIRTRAWRSSWTRKIGFGDIGMRSLWYHWKELQRLCKSGSIDLVFIPVPPSVPMVLGRLAHMRFGLPYVIDYIDPWVTEYYWRVPRSERPPKWPFAYAMARVLEPFAVGRVGHITGVSEGTTESVVTRYSRLTSNDATTIPYGSEPSDFSYLRRNPRTNSVFDHRDGRFHLSYVGACIPGMHPTVQSLFEAFKLGLEEEPELFGKVRFHFVGTSYAPTPVPARIAGMAAEMGIANYVDEMTSRVPYLESLQVMLDSSGLLLIGSDESHYTPSKVFPSLLARKPILAIFHQESSVKDILRNTDGKVITYSETEPPKTRVAEISSALKNMLTQEPDSSEEPVLSEIGFTARSMTARLVAAFESALARQPRSEHAKQVSAGLTNE